MKRIIQQVLVFLLLFGSVTAFAQEDNSHYIDIRNRWLMLSKQKPLYDKLHENGVMCMISVAPTHDQRFTEAERVAGYKSETMSPCDVIETDYPYLFQGVNLQRQK